MSNIYIQEPSTEGKVLLVTSAGDIDIELWSREAPKACRNFIQLCLENYYNGTIFHRVLPGFIAQGGDPTGTGEGGESIYGKPFRDEFHSRLRFVRRGLVAMANAGPNDNGSQFFFTLGQCPELQNKHTIFGKVTGDTFYNLPKFEEGIIGKDDRPEYPHKIIKTEVLNNPFPDIVPRAKIVNELPKELRKRKKKGTKNFKLLSFGDEAEEEEEEVLLATKSFSNKGNSAHDIAMDPTLSSSTGSNAGTSEGAEALERIRKKLSKDENAEELINNELEDDESKEDKEEDSKEENVPESIKEEDPEKMEKMAAVKNEIKQLKQELSGKKPKVEPEVEEEVKEKDSDTVRDYKMEKAKYEEEKKKLPSKGSTREQQTLALLQRFSAKVYKAFGSNYGSDGEDEPAEEEEEDDEDGWMKQKLHFDETAPILAKDASTKNDTWYEMDDPRNPLNKRRREDTSKQPSKKHRQ